jgi:hypothetical protein
LKTQLEIERGRERERERVAIPGTSDMPPKRASHHGLRPKAQNVLWCHPGYHVRRLEETERVPAHKDDPDQQPFLINYRVYGKHNKMLKLRPKRSKRGRWDLCFAPQMPFFPDVTCWAIVVLGVEVLTQSLKDANKMWTRQQGRASRYTFIECLLSLSGPAPQMRLEKR